jgi:hypothetical protein
MSVILVAPVFALVGELNLPSAFVRMEVSDGIESYFNTMLGEVPSEYDVTNATYLGWCVDARTEMIRSPAIHTVSLYSSMSPPGELANEGWDMINYILNHKQGDVQDIQQAIWYFMHIGGAQYIPSRTAAWTIVNDTLENGSGFAPSPGQVVAVICYPTILFPNQPDVQISIIEVRIGGAVSEFSSAFALLPTMVIVLLVALIYAKKLKNPR